LQQDIQGREVQPFNLVLGQNLEGRRAFDQLIDLHQRLLSGGCSMPFFGA
jgi:hypothetical protein